MIEMVILADPCEKCQARFHSRQQIEESWNFFSFDNVSPNLMYFHMCNGTCVDAPLTCLPEERSAMGYWINGIICLAVILTKSV